jgi:23S rRNA (guanosine2251-2'-O)-methyltransferase
MNKDVLFGVHAVREWLTADPKRILAVMALPNPNDRVRRVLQRAQEAGVPIEEISRDALTRIAGPRNAQGIAARVAPFPFKDLDTVLADAGPSPMILVADGVTDPVNMGGILRNAAFFGVSAVLLPRDRSAALSPVVERTAAGAAARVPICRENSLLRSIESLKERGFRVFASVVGGHPLPKTHDLSGPIVLMVGSEGKGLRPSLRRVADGKTSLPSFGPGSLNVAAFTSVLLYEACRQRTVD